MRKFIPAALIAGLASVFGGCGAGPAQDSPEEFRSHLEEVAKASEGGKALKKAKPDRADRTNPLDDTF